MSVKDWSKPIQTVDGRKARLLGELKASSVHNESRVVAVEEPNGDEHAKSYFEDGQYFSDRKSQHDIINVPPRRVMREVEAWAVVDRNGEALTHHGTRERASTSWGLERAGARIVRLTGAIEVEVEE